MNTIAAVTPPVSQIPRSQRRERAIVARRDPIGGQPHVVEEGGGVRVTLVALVPDAGNTLDLEIAGDQDSLAGARRGADPHRRSFRGLLEYREEPLPQHGPHGLGRRDLGQVVGPFCLGAPFLPA
jgi:hypothetical protein